MINAFVSYLAHEKRYSPLTQKAYQTDLEQLSQYLETNRLTSDLTEADFAMLRSWIVSLAEQSRSTRSINRKIATLKSFYKFLQQQGTISSNPASRLRSLKQAQHTPKFIQEREILLLLNDLPFGEDFVSLRDKLTLELLYGTGIRLAELLQVSYSSLCFDTQQLRVLGKGNKERLIPLHKTLLLLVKQYEEVKQNMFGSYRKDLPLILTNSGEPAYPMLIYRIVKSYLGLVTSNSKRSPHVLRHSFATHLLERGADLNAIKDLLGHASLSATQVYTHNSLGKLKSIFKQAHPKA